MKESMKSFIAVLAFMAIIAAGIGFVIALILWIGAKTVCALFAAFVTIVFAWVVYETIRDEINQHRKK